MVIDCPRNSKGLNPPSHKEMAIVGEMEKKALIVAGCDSNFIPRFQIFLFLRKKERLCF